MAGMLVLPSAIIGLAVIAALIYLKVLAGESILGRPNSWGGGFGKGGESRREDSMVSQFGFSGDRDLIGGVLDLSISSTDHPSTSELKVAGLRNGH